MKKGFMFSLICVVLLAFGCTMDNSSGMIGDNAGIMNAATATGGAPSFSTPVVFVHGIESIGGDTFYNMYEKFASYGFPEGMMAMPLLPRIKIGSLNINYAWYTLVSTYNYKESHWNANYINADVLKSEIDQLLSTTGATQVDLVGHSNGSCVIRKLLARYAKPGDDLYGKIRKIVFISGFADVSGASNLDNIGSDMNYTMPFESLPRNIEYYAISSESDANADNMESILGNPDNSNPAPFDGTGRYWPMDDSDDFCETNVNFTGIDHHQLVTCSQTIAQVFSWLTGADPGTPSTPSSITIGGKVVLAGGTYAYQQDVVISGTVTVTYYDPATGQETGAAGSTSISTTGRYSIGNISTSQYIKMTITANGGTNVYFFANKITQNSNAIDFNAPEELTSYTSAGYVSVRVLCRYSYLSYYGYAERPKDEFAGKVEANGYTTKTIGNSCLTRLSPSIYNSIYLKNFGFTNTLYDNEYKFGSTTYGSNDVFVTADLQNTGVKTKIKINGADRNNNIDNFIVYLYR